MSINHVGVLPKFPRWNGDQHVLYNEMASFRHRNSLNESSSIIAWVAFCCNNSDCLWIRDCSSSLNPRQQVIASSISTLIKLTDFSSLSNPPLALNPQINGHNAHLLYSSASAPDIHLRHSACTHTQSDEFPANVISLLR